jgi:hypothetical protein
MTGHSLIGFDVGRSAVVAAIGTGTNAAVVRKSSAKPVASIETRSAADRLQSLDGD